MIITLKAVSDKILAQKIEEEKSPKGILILNEKKPYITAKVCAVCPNCDGLDVDDIIFVNEHSCTEVEIQGEKYFSIHKSSILGGYTEWEEK